MQGRGDSNDGPRDKTVGYRRNQTLSGVRHVTEENSSRRKVHSLADKRRKAGLGFLISAAVVVLLSVLLFQLIGSVVLTSGSADLSRSFSSKEEEYREAISSYFGTQPVERLKFLLNEEALTNYVGGVFPEVKTLKLSEDNNLAEARFVIEFRKPVAGWQIKDRQYYVDSEGVVFEENYFISPGVQIVDESGVDVQQGGGVVASGRLLGFVGRVVSLSESGGHKVTKVVLPEGTTRRLDVTYEGVAPTIRFSVDRGAGEQVSEATLSISHLASRGLSAQYIDVRVAGRAVYR